MNKSVSQRNLATNIRDTYKELKPGKVAELQKLCNLY